MDSVKPRIPGLLALGLLAAALGANAVAVPAAWNLSGKITEVSGNDLPVMPPPPGPSGIHFIDVGDAFSFTLNFNSLAPLTNPLSFSRDARTDPATPTTPSGSGTRCNHCNEPLLQITNFFIDGADLTATFCAIRPQPQSAHLVAFRSRPTVALEPDDG